MWHTSENGSQEKPIAVDRESSKKYVIVRKDFQQVYDHDEEGQITGYHWRYQEAFVPKEYYDIFDQAETNKADIAYIAMMADIDL